MIRWELHQPQKISSVLLNDISELRGRVLYDNGRRPAFRLKTGRFSDSDPLDPHAFHIIARNNSNSVGCVRNVPLTDGITCLTERLLGQTRFAKMLATFGVKRKQVVESSRWMLDPNFRNSGIGASLAAGSVAVAHNFNFELLICSVGTRDKQDKLLSRLGLRRVPDIPLIPVAQYNDELCVMFIQPHSPPPHLKKLMDEMDVELNLNPDRNPLEQKLSERAEYPLQLNSHNWK
jgi:N-acyl-L-homoserine lactone synthetase